MKKMTQLLVLGFACVSISAYAGHCCSSTDYDDERRYPDSNYYRDTNSVYYDRDGYDLRVDNSQYYRHNQHQIPENNGYCCPHPSYQSNQECCD